MAEHTYVKYINHDGLSQASPEGAMFKETITMDGMSVIESRISAIEESDIEAWRRAKGGGTGAGGEIDGKAEE